MDRTTIVRSTFKKNFLKEIIMRLDFQGVLQAEMEDILLLVKPYLKEKSFNRYDEKVTNEIVNNGSVVTDIKSQIVYTFISEAAGYELKLSNTSIILSVRSQSYASFEAYSEIFRNVASIYKEKIDFFTVKRFGLRKINFCFIQDRNKINNYFLSSYYNIDTPIDGYSALSNERLDKLAGEKTSINLKYAVEEGQVENITIFKVTLDSDIYSMDQEEITDIVFNETHMGEINDRLFGIYINVLTDEFIELLSNEEDMPDGTVLGVEMNE